MMLLCFKNVFEDLKKGFFILLLSLFCVPTSNTGVHISIVPICIEEKKDRETIECVKESGKVSFPMLLKVNVNKPFSCVIRRLIKRK